MENAEVNATFKLNEKLINARTTEHSDKNIVNNLKIRRNQQGS